MCAANVQVNTEMKTPIEPTVYAPLHPYHHPHKKVAIVNSFITTGKSIHVCKRWLLIAAVSQN